jgi:hypothetical protein
MINEAEIVKELYNTLNSGTLQKNYKIKPIIFYSKGDESVKPKADFEIYFKDELVGLLEIKTQLFFPGKVAESFFKKYDNSYKIFLITDGRKYYLYNFLSFHENKRPTYSGGLTPLIKRHFQYSNKATSQNELKIKFERIFNDLVNKLFKISSIKITKQEVINSIKNSFQMDEKRKLIMVNSSSEQTKNRIEYILFNLIFDAPEPNKDGETIIYRYTTMDSVFSTLNKLKYRINGIQGMNDQKEGIFTLSQIFRNRIDLENDVELSNRFNQIFISSCSKHKDNLTMWRLYGDNSKGISLELAINSNIKNPFVIKNVTYVGTRREEEILNILTTTVNEFLNYGYTLSPEILSLIPFFLKVNHYNVEGEIRVLYDKTLHQSINPATTEFDWGIAKPLNIARPYVDFNMLKPDGTINDELPFKIKSIVLGPNCPHEKRNLLQFKTLLTEKGFGHVPIVQSSIDRDIYIG